MLSARHSVHKIQAAPPASQNWFNRVTAGSRNEASFRNTTADSAGQRDPATASAQNRCLPFFGRPQGVREEISLRRGVRNTTFVVAAAAAIAGGVVCRQIVGIKRDPESGGIHRPVAGDVPICYRGAQRNRPGRNPRFAGIHGKFATIGRLVKLADRDLKGFLRIRRLAHRDDAA